MEYTPQQLAIIRRMGEISARIREATEAHQAATETLRASQADEARHLIDVITSLRRASDNLTEAVNYNGQVTRLFVEHSDAFREFLDTLG